MKLGLPGGGDDPPQFVAPKSDFHAVYRRLRELRAYHKHHCATNIARNFERGIDRVSKRIQKQFRRFGGKLNEMPPRPYRTTRADQAYVALQETARQADRDRDLARAGEIREALDATHRYAAGCCRRCARNTASPKPRPRRRFSYRRRRPDRP